jgi:hypothetical protein
MGNFEISLLGFLTGIVLFAVYNLIRKALK